MKVKWLTIKSPCRKFQFHLFISGGEDKILYCLIDITCTILITKTPSLSLIRTLNFLQSHIFTTLKKDMSYNSPHQKKLGFLFLTKVSPIKVSRSHSQGLSLFQSCVFSILLKLNIAYFSLFIYNSLCLNCRYSQLVQISTLVSLGIRLPLKLGLPHPMK